MTESQQILPPPLYGDEVDLRELFRVLWVGKWLIGGITFAATLIAVIVAIMLPNIYRAEALLAPNQDGGAGGLAELAAKYGGIVSLTTGVNLGGVSSDQTTLGLEVLRSRKFISQFIEHHDILVPLMAVKGWDSETGNLNIDPDDYDAASGEWVRDVRPPRKTTPSLQEAYEDFMNVLSVDQENTTGFVTIAVEHYSPTVAKQWVDWLIEDVNTTIMRQDVEEARHAIEYLNKQIRATSLAELHNVFFRLVEEQTKTVMLAEVSDEYLFRTVDPAVVPELKAKPTRALIAAMGLFFGGLIGVIAVYVKNSCAVKRA